MTGFWRTWMMTWCGVVAAFGVMLALAALPATDGPTRLFVDLVSGFRGEGAAFDLPLVRFTYGVLGAVMIGWGLTLFGMVRAADVGGAPVWRAMTTAMVVWFLADSAASMATGYPLNAASNTLFLLAYLAPVVGSGVLGGGQRRAAA